MSYQLLSAPPSSAPTRTRFAVRDGRRKVVLRDLQDGVQPFHPVVTGTEVLALMEVATVEGVRSAVYDFVEGVSLGELIEALEDQGREVPLALIGSVVLQAAKAMISIHATQPPAPAHGGLSDSSIFIGFDGVVRIMDYGAPRPGRFQLPGMKDVPADVFALGAVLHAALTDFGGNYGEAVNAGTPLPQPSRLHEEATDALDDVVMRAVSRVAWKRQVDARHFSEELEAALAGTLLKPKQLSGSLGEIFPDRAAGQGTARVAIDSDLDDEERADNEPTSMHYVPPANSGTSPSLPPVPDVLVPVPGKVPWVTGQTNDDLGDVQQGGGDDDDGDGIPEGTQPAYTMPRGIPLETQPGMPGPAMSKPEHVVATGAPVRPVAQAMPSGAAGPQARVSAPRGPPPVLAPSGAPGMAYPGAPQSSPPVLRPSVPGVAASLNISAPPELRPLAPGGPPVLHPSPGGPPVLHPSAPGAPPMLRPSAPPPGGPPVLRPAAPPAGGPPVPAPPRSTGEKAAFRPSAPSAQARGSAPRGSTGANAALKPAAIPEVDPEVDTLKAKRGARATSLERPVRPAPKPVDTQEETDPRGQRSPAGPSDTDDDEQPLGEGEVEATRPRPRPALAARPPEPEADPSMSGEYGPSPSQEFGPEQSGDFGPAQSGDDWGADGGAYGPENTTEEERAAARGQERISTPPLGVPAALDDQLFGDLPDDGIENEPTALKRRPKAIDDAIAAEEAGDDEAPSELVDKPKKRGGRGVIMVLLLLIAGGFGYVALKDPQRLEPLKQKLAPYLEKVGLAPPKPVELVTPVEPMPDVADAGPAAETGDGGAAAPTVLAGGLDAGLDGGEVGDGGADDEDLDGGDDEYEDDDGGVEDEDDGGVEQPGDGGTVSADGGKAPTKAVTKKKKKKKRRRRR